MTKKSKICQNTKNGIENTKSGMIGNQYRHK